MPAHLWYDGKSAIENIVYTTSDLLCCLIVDIVELCNVAAQSTSTQTMPILPSSSLPVCHAQLSFQDTVNAVGKMMELEPLQTESATTALTKVFI